MEDSFGFFNRAAGPVWERIRGELDSWYATFPDPDGDLWKRFRRREREQHLAAWWELYVHHLFSRLGFDIEHHPDLSDTGNHPDFRLTRDDAVLYVEAVTTFSGIAPEGRHAGREADVLAAVDSAGNSSFLLGIEFDHVGEQTPRLGSIKSRVAEWLRPLDPDEVKAAVDSGAPYPSTRLRFGDWVIALEAIPLRPENRGASDHRMIGTGPTTGGAVNDVGKLTKTLDRKRRYGELDGPLVIAVLSASTFMREHDVERVLCGGYGYRERGSGSGPPKIREADGFWRRSQKVAGVLVGIQIYPHTCASTWPRLWHNPNAATPCHVELPFPTARWAGSQTEFADASQTPAEVLALPSDWPGPRPFFGPIIDS